MGGCSKGGCLIPGYSITWGRPRAPWGAIILPDTYDWAWACCRLLLFIHRAGMLKTYDYDEGIFGGGVLVRHVSPIANLWQ